VERAGILRVGIVLVLLILTGCAEAQHYYLQSSLNSLTVGMPKETLLSGYSGTTREGHQAPGMVIRAARKTERGNVLEVAELPMLSPEGRITTFWFLFDDGQLIQWGRPEDWRRVSARYDINFNPTPYVPR
jgi:hypothetical protein